MTGRQPIGSFALVLHTHMPWLAHHGTWPVGEEWLHQAFTGSWRRIVVMLESLAEQGFRDVATLGITPITAAMLDDPYCLRELHAWTGRWQLRAEQLSMRPDLATFAELERTAATECLADLEGRWLTGGVSAVLRPLLDDGVVELLGGPATHPFLPLLTPRLAEAQLRLGLDDARLRFGGAAAGIWAPECGYTPGIEDLKQEVGIEYFLVDEPALVGRAGAGRLVADSDVAVFARDRALSQRIWAARTGYPAAVEYRDFHSFDHRSGFRPFRVTGLDVPASHKSLWDPAAARRRAHADAASFVADIVARLGEPADTPGLPLLVAAFDTELFGHWWYEGPEFLAEVLRLLPQAGVRLTTLSGARSAGQVVGRTQLAPGSSWGAGGDWRVWDNEQVADLVSEAEHVQKRLFALLDGLAARGLLHSRDPALEQLAREALLTTASDWAFMITRQSAADYARDRARGHAQAFHELAELIERGDGAAASDLARRSRLVDGPFGHLDVRRF